MQPTCVNPEEPIDVVYLPEVRDEEFIKRQIASLEGLLREIPTKIAEGMAGNPASTPTTDSARRLSWLQSPLGIAVSCITVLIFIGTLLHFGFRAEFHDAFDQPFNGLRDTVNSLRDKDVAGLHKDVEHVSTDVGRLLDWQARMVFTPQTSKAGTGVFTPNELKEVAKRARIQKIPADVTAIQAAAKPLEQRNDEASWAALIELVNLRSFVNSTLREAQQHIVQTITKGTGTTLVPLAQRSRTEWVEIVAATITLGGDESDFGVILAPNGEVAHVLETIIFKDANIVYRGGKVTLINVFFDNCTFEIKNGANGKEFAKNILDPRPFTNFVAN